MCSKVSSIIARRWTPVSERQGHRGVDERSGRFIYGRLASGLHCVVFRDLAEVVKHGFVHVNELEAVTVVHVPKPVLATLSYPQLVVFMW